MSQRFREAKLIPFQLQLQHESENPWAEESSRMTRAVDTKLSGGLKIAVAIPLW